MSCLHLPHFSTLSLIPLFLVLPFRIERQTIHWGFFVTDGEHCCWSTPTLLWNVSVQAYICFSLISLSLLQNAIERKFSPCISTFLSKRIIQEEQNPSLPRSQTRAAAQDLSRRHKRKDGKGTTLLQGRMLLQCLLSKAGKTLRGCERV